jgi:predicted ester cyclase
MMIALFAAFPDTKFPIEDIIAVGDKVVVRYKINGTHKGAFQGIPATGKKVNVEGINILKIAGGVG